MTAEIDDANQPEDDAPKPAEALPDGPTRCGFVALIGEPNAGKSTLLNRMVGAKVSIVTHKVQTTRARIRGVALEGASQIVFIDTPGLFRPRRRLDRASRRRKRRTRARSLARVRPHGAHAAGGSSRGGPRLLELPRRRRPRLHRHVRPRREWGPLRRSPRE